MEFCEIFFSKSVCHHHMNFLPWVTNMMDYTNFPHVKFALHSWNKVFFYVISM